MELDESQDLETRALSPAQAAELAADEALSPERHPVVVYLAGLSRSSQRTMRQALGRVAQLALQKEDVEATQFAWQRLRYEHTQILRGLLLQTVDAGLYAPATANKCLAALRGVLKTAWRLELMSAENYQRAVDLKPIPGSRLPRGRRLELGEMAAFFQHCAAERTKSAFLDAALFAVMAGGGLRRAEVVALDFADFSPDQQTIRVIGKGNKERSVPLSAAATDALCQWLNVVRGLEQGPLFCPVRKGGRLEFRRMTDQAVYDRLNRRRRAAGLATFTPHDLRRTFSSGMIDAGADVLVVQKLLGHADVSTTSRYDMRGEKAKRKAVELFHVPYVQFSELSESRSK